MRFARFLLVSALMISIGAQWAALQTAAWVSMAVSYTINTGSISEGLSETFDGRHPCKLCCLVKKGSESEKKDPKQESVKKKLELFAGETRRHFMVPAVTQMNPAVDDVAVVHAHAPPVPPPRVAA